MYRRTMSNLFQFGCSMATKLANNDHKTGWGDCTFKWLLKRLRQEVGELNRAIEDAGILGDVGHCEVTAEQKAAIRSEAADVANFAFMINDLVRIKPVTAS